MAVLMLLIMLIANGVSRQFKDKCSLYGNIIDFLNSYELNIGFKKDKMVQLIEKHKTIDCSKMMFVDYLDYLKHDKEFDKSNFKMLEEDADYVIEMFKDLGHGDYEQELKKTENYKQYLKKKFLLAEEKQKKLCPLITKLSFLFGLVVVLLII